MRLATKTKRSILGRSLVCLLPSPWASAGRGPVVDSPNLLFPSHILGRAPMTLHLLGFSLAMYVGPDQILPLTSIIGAIGGALMIFWRQVVGIAKRIASVFKR